MVKVHLTLRDHIVLAVLLGLSWSIPVPGPFSKTIRVGKACHHTILIATTADRANSAVCRVAAYKFYTRS